MRITLTSLFLILAAASSASAENMITYYQDGALLVQEATAVKGVVDVPLAGGLLERTLTVVPDPGTTIVGVVTHKTDTAGSADKELEALVEQRRRMEDRLQALETREAIFIAAAKAQSGKAPRKTKANPDPMLAIRQGTEFAIAQLEAVYTARRKTTQEIKRIDTQLAAARKGSHPVENSVRITVTPLRGRVTLRYATTERGWQPRYDLHLLGDGTARLEQSAYVSGTMRGYQNRVSSGTLAESVRAETFPLRSGGAILTSIRVPLSEERSVAGIYNQFSATLTNSSPHYLPPGESGLFRKGTYLGKFRFDGLSSGKSRNFSH